MKSFLDSIDDWLTLACEAQFRVPRLARLCKVSTRHLERYFRQSFCCPPQYWLNEVRMCAARQLLRDRKSAKETAATLGYIHSSHFILKFKEYHGYTTRQFLAIERRRAAKRRECWPEEWIKLEEEQRGKWLHERDAQALLSIYRQRRGKNRAE